MSRVIDNDQSLLEYGPSERAVAHRLAVYLEQEFPGWHTDCEYNRQGGGKDRKQVILRGDLTNADPDIIIHRRGCDGLDGSNLLAIEVKPDVADQSKKNYDVNKLLGYANDHHYTFAVFVMYSTGANPGFYEPKRIQAN